MITIRQTVSQLMVAIHRISPALADYHVAEMTDEDLAFRLQMYHRLGIAGAELSVVGPNLRSGDLSSTRFSGPETMTAGSRHSTLFPTGQAMPDSEVKNRGKTGPAINRA